jgi:uncharacterized DUF497 family protein
MLQRHGVSVSQAMEAIADPDAVLFSPDPKSRSGSSARLLGYSASCGQVLVIILVTREDRPDAWWGANGWVATTTDRSRYRRENDHE